MVSRWRSAAATAAALITLALALTAASAAAAPNLAYVSGGWITNGSSPALLSGATLTRSGDLLVVFNNSGDGVAGAGAYLTRSSDEGATWTRPALLRAPSGIYRDPVTGVDRGSVNAALGLTTLADGTLLLPFTESVNIEEYTNRTSQTYVARSTDDGATWSGLTTPIALPASMYYNATYGQIVELSGGTLLMPVWGAVNRPSTPSGLEDPEPWQAGVLRSFDGGRTWSDYRRIGVDAVSLPPISNPWGQFPSNITETTIRPLRDGRLLAMMRSDTTLGVGTGFWSAWSGDGGVTWTDVVWTGYNGITHDVAVAPCSASLSGGRTKLIMGQTDPTAGNGLRLVTRVSFDGGWRWVDEQHLVDPAGMLAGRRTYPNFVPLPGNRMFVVYGSIPTTGVPRLAFNVLQDATGSACQAQADAAAADSTARRTIFVQRADAASWPWPFARNQVRDVAATATLGSIATTLASRVTCTAPSGIVIRKAGVTLDQSRTLADLGVVTGDRLVVSSVDPPRALKVGWADYDTEPAYRRVQSWDTACDTRMALDYRSRSLVLDVPLAGGQSITSVSVRHNGASTAASTSAWVLWTSADGHSWTVVPGAVPTTAVVGGKVVVTFSGLSLTQRYVKISQPQTQNVGSFVIWSTRSDVNVTTSP